MKTNGWLGRRIQVWPLTKQVAADSTHPKWVLSMHWKMADHMRIADIIPDTDPITVCFSIFYFPRFICFAFTFEITTTTTEQRLQSSNLFIVLPTHKLGPKAKTRIEFQQLLFNVILMAFSNFVAPHLCLYIHSEL
jgi:hypothetical protein